MRLRLSKETRETLGIASDVYGETRTEIARKALRKWRRLRPDLSNVDPGATTDGEALSLSIPKELTRDLDPDRIRRIIQWYLDLHDLKPPTRFKPDLVEGRDYVVKQHNN